MAGKRKHHTAAFKAQVALAAIKGDRTVNELAGQFGIHPTLIHAWKKQLVAGAELAFTNGVKVDPADAEARQAELFEQIGRLKMELEWVKKKAAVLGGTASSLDRGRWIRSERPPPVRAFGAEPLQPVLRAGGRAGGELATDAADRRGVHRSSLPR